jgi:RNA polymerase sigma factor (sigma-70 family)
VAVYEQGIHAGSNVRLRFASDERLVGLVRRGDRTAFEVLYDRHAAQLLSFCMYMLGSRHDAEDALQTTLASAHRTLLADERPITLRPWLFAIARNACLDILRRRRPWVEFNGEPARGGEPPRELELREEVRQLVEGILELPERQRTALILAELNGLSQVEIAAAMGVRRDQVKAYAYQARSSLISEREARDSDCGDIRETLASARGAAVLRSRIRRHLRSCEGCREYRRGLAGQRRAFGLLLPVAPSIGLKHSTLQGLLGGGALPVATAEGVAVGGSVAGAAVEIASGGAKVLVVKLLVGAAVAGAGASLGVSALGLSILPGAPSAATSRAKPAPGRLAAFVESADAAGRLVHGSVLAGVTVLHAIPAGGGGDGSESAGATAQQNPPAARSGHDRQTAGVAAGGGGDANESAEQRKKTSERNRHSKGGHALKTEAERQKKGEPRTRKSGQQPRREEHAPKGEGEGREREKERARRLKEQEREKERARALKEQEREKARRLKEHEKRKREKQKAKRPSEREAREEQNQRERVKGQEQRQRERGRSRKLREHERSKRDRAKPGEREARQPSVLP